MSIEDNYSIYNYPVFRTKKRKRQCKLCYAHDNQFVYDSKHDDTICTYCGCVQDKSFNLVEHDIYHEQEPIPWIENDMQKQQQKMSHMLMDKVDIKNNTFHNILNLQCEQLQVLDNVKYDAIAIFNNFKQLQRLKPFKTVVAAVIVIAEKENGKYVNIKDFEQRLNVKKLSKMVNKISKDILKIDNITYTMASIHKYVFLLHMEYKEHIRIKKMFKVATDQNNSMGNDTLLALCLYIRVKQLKLDKKYPNINLKFIADITNTSINSLHGYITKKTKCTLFR